MIDDSKWVGTFESTGLKFTIETPGSSELKGSWYLFTKLLNLEQYLNKNDI